MDTTSKYLYVLFFNLLLMSCRQADSDKPVIEYVALNGSVDSHLHGLSGAPLDFEIKTTDNKELSQLKLQLTTPVGFHGHDENTENISLMELTFQSPIMGQWNQTFIYNLEGKSVVKNISLPCPDSLSGGWEMLVQVLDAEGNLASNEYIVHLFNDNLPDILPDSVTPTPDENGIIHLMAGQTLVMYGDIIDVNDSLMFIETTVTQANDTVQHQMLSDINHWSYQMEALTIPPFTEAGNYHLYVKAGDMLGWTNWKRVKIEVSE